jgi:transcriptional antiterminator RfaH
LDDLLDNPAHRKTTFLISLEARLNGDPFCAVSATMSFWACARVLPQRESLAAVCLAERGFEIFAPVIETRRSVALLFPMHIFVLIISQWRAIDCTPGVLKLIRFGDCPAKVPDAEIEALRARADDRGVIRLRPPPPPKSRHVFRKGDRVRILAGPFASFSALHTGMNHRERERVLIEILGARREVTVANHLVAMQ